MLMVDVHLSSIRTTLQYKRAPSSGARGMETNKHWINHGMDSLYRRSVMVITLDADWMGMVDAYLLDDFTATQKSTKMYR